MLFGLGQTAYIERCANCTLDIPWAYRQWITKASQCWPYIRTVVTVLYMAGAPFVWGGRCGQPNCFYFPPNGKVCPEESKLSPLTEPERDSLQSGGALSQSMQRVLSFFSRRRNWDSPNPSPASECAPSPRNSPKPLPECVPPRLWCGGRTHSLGGEGVGGQ